MIKKRKQRTYFKKIIFLILLVAVAAAGARYRGAIARYWTMIMLIAEQKDARALALSLRHEPLGILCVTANPDASEECYLFDVNGVVFDKARTVVNEVIVKVHEQSDVRPTITLPFVPPADWQNLRLILEAVRTKKLNVNRIALTRTDKEITLTILPHNTLFYFSYAFDPRDHLKALPEFFKKVSLEELRYVDLRVEGKIFYK